MGKEKEGGWLMVEGGWLREDGDRPAGRDFVSPDVGQGRDSRNRREDEKVRGWEGKKLEVGDRKSEGD